MLNELKQDETGRMMALKRLDVLDTQEEQPFEKIVNLVQQVLHVPMCAVSLVDLSRFCAAPGARLSHLSFEGDRAFPAQC